MRKRPKPKKTFLKDLTSEEIDKIIQLRKDKVNILSISKQLWITKSLIKNVINKSVKKNLLPIKVVKPKNYKKAESSVTMDERQEIKRLRANSFTPSQISKKLKIELNLVKVILHEQNYNVRWKKFRDNEKAFSGIYMIQNDINKKIYIGQSQDIVTRWQQHLTNKTGEHTKEFDSDLQEFGLSAFSFKILVCHPALTKEQLYKLENTFIRHYDSIKKGYNKIYSRKNSFYDIDLTNKTAEQILDFVMTEAKK